MIGGRVLRRSGVVEVNDMRFMWVVLDLIALGSVAFVPPAQAAQHGPHPAPPAHARAALHPAGEAHSTPVPVPQRIASNPALVARLQPLVPSGMTLAGAAAGFNNQKQFIAVLHVSRNLNIPFAQLKAEMTGSEHDSLGQAIHDLRPAANVKAAVKTAQQQARADLKATRPMKTDTDDEKGDR
jgi:hypothetical protein